jgi:hypothetical protein
MKLVVFVVVLMLGVFVSGQLGDEWDSFDGGDSEGSSVDVSVETGGFDVGVGGDVGGAFEYTTDFYIALGVGAVGILVVGLFLYFFLRHPKNKWKKSS